MGKLHREIGLIGLTFVSVSAIIGSGWLFAPLLAAQHAGPAALVAWVLGGIAMLLLALTFAEISAMLPVPGGIARVPQFSHGNVVSMAMGWSGWVGYSTTAPIEVEAMLRYLAPHLDWLYTAPGSGTLSWGGVALAGGLLALFTVINAFGVKFFAYVNTTITWAKLAIPMLVIALFLASRFETANFTAHGGFAPMGLAGILGAISSGGVIFSYIGFRHAIDMAGEVKNPGRTVPLALVLSVLICFLIYGGLQFAFTGALAPGDLAKGWGALALPGELGPLSAIAAALGLLWLVSLLNFGAVIGPFGGGLVAVGSNARLAFALAENGFFPKLFASISARGVPLAALLLNLAFAVLAFVLLPFDEVVQLNSAAIILSFAVGPVAVVALRSLLPQATRPLRIPGVFFVALAAFVVATLIIYWSGWNTVWRLGICLAVGLALFLVNARARMTRELDVTQALWLVPYLLGIAIVSYLGAFGGRGIIPFGLDMAILALLAALVFVYAIKSRLPQETFDRYMREEQVLETLSADAPIDPLATPGEVRV
ncbi:APC family permease [Xanthobacter tagetidis]|uniref:APC family permease n=1 Tax=Xanthobacter tagetidis TaxID=60216 RepID=A0A3L7ABI1_9HYPH|nr:APC family permease [Xanthobacter tagetidis]MBB6309537.1 amino acid transporter [Xanthobacter tagetidis]RLP77098.1 APC family permease [Xanthobacter tagetidis]